MDPTVSNLDQRTRMLLEAPIAATLLRLAAPNMLVMVVQSAVGLIETYFVGKLGTDALAGVALVFPVLMLMQMMSAGADPAMLEVGSNYLQTVGPLYGLFGLGMALYFASQGAGRLLWPLLANLTRLSVAAGGGWLALRLSGDLAHVFLATARRSCC